MLVLYHKIMTGTKFSVTNKCLSENSLPISMLRISDIYVDTSKNRILNPQFLNPG